MSANLFNTLRACETLRDSTRSAYTFMLDNISPNSSLVDALNQVLSSCTDACDIYINDIRTNLNLQSYALTVFFEDADAVVKGLAKKFQGVVDLQEVVGGKQNATGDDVFGVEGRGVEAAVGGTGACGEEDEVFCWPSAAEAD